MVLAWEQAVDVIFLSPSRLVTPQHHPHLLYLIFPQQRAMSCLYVSTRFGLLLSQVLVIFCAF